MSRRWVIGGVAVVGALVVAALWTWCLAAPSCPSAPLSDEENISDARRGQRIVAAIYQFKEDVGLWPQRLEDLVPDYLSAKPPAYWQYNWFPHGQWSLTCLGGLPHTALRFRYGEGSGEWFVTDGDWDEPLKAGFTEPKPRPADPAERNRRVLFELGARIPREPKMLWHRQALIVHLVRQGKFREARGVCEACPQPLPEDWWPQKGWWPPLALAIIDAKCGQQAEAEKRLRAWADEKGEFGYHFLLAYYQELTGLPGRARETLLAAARLPMRDFPRATREMDWRAWEATHRLYREGDFEVTLAICKRWEEYRGWRDPMDPSYLTYRAASLLALGRFAEADEAMAAVLAVGLAIKWANNTEALGEAVKRRDRAFRYVATKQPTRFTWEPTYE